MLTTERIRQILESRDYTVDITCEPFGSVPGFVSFHRTGYPGQKAIIKGLKRVFRLQDNLESRLAESMREMECQKTTSPSETDAEDGSSR